MVPVKYKLLILVLCLLSVIFLFFFRGPITDTVISTYHLLSEKDQVKDFVASFGKGAPFVFLGVQIFQVLFAPVPGEVTGFVGGYLFGAFNGFILSSIGLTIGSWIIFLFSRFAGKKFIRKLIPANHLKRFDAIVKPQGILILFILFVIPGFPKDYLCLFLGLTALPVKLFIILSSIGRMPGTLILSLQGEFLFKQMYGVFAVVFSVSLVIIIVAFLYRKNIYQWMGKFY